MAEKRYDWGIFDKWEIVEFDYLGVARELSSRSGHCSVFCFGSFAQILIFLYFVSW